MTRWYFDYDVRAYSGFLKMELSLLHFVQERYDKCVFSDQALDRIIGEICNEENRILKENPRLRSVDIRFGKPEPPFRPDGYLKIGNAYVRLAPIIEWYDE